MAQFTQPKTAKVTEVKPEDLPEEVRESVLAARDMLRSFGRMETSSVFLCGKAAAEIKALSPDQKDFARNCKNWLNISRRSAENAASVYVNLGTFQERLLPLGLRQTVLYALAKAQPEQVDTLLERCEAGAKLTVAQVNRVVKGDSDKSETVSDSIGGLTSMRAVAALQFQELSKSFLSNLEEMAVDTHLLLQSHHDGKRVEKGRAKDLLVQKARLARTHLDLVLYVPTLSSGQASTEVAFAAVAEGRWLELREGFVRLSVPEAWPEAAEVGTWLEELLPQFEWALGDKRAARAKASALRAQKLAAGKSSAKAKAARKPQRAPSPKSATNETREEKRAKLAAFMGRTMDEILESQR